MSNEHFHIQQFTVPGQRIREYPGASLDGSDCQFDLCVTRYVPKHRANATSDPLNIIAAGGNSFPKELYQPLWADLLQQAHGKRWAIKAIWTLDMAHQGDSGLLNAKKLGDDPSWFDYARDILQLVNCFREEMATPIIGIGHSIGATALIHLSTFHPRLFSQLVLVEPILGSCTREGIYFAHSTLQSPDVWPTKAAAEAYMRKSPPFTLWDERVCRCWLEHGLTANHSSGSGVKLKTSKHQAAVTYVRPLCGALPGEDGEQSPLDHEQKDTPDLHRSTERFAGFYCPASEITMPQLPNLRPRTLFVFGRDSVMSPKDKRSRILEFAGTGIAGNGGQSSGKVQQVTVPNVGHLLPFENPSECAATVSDALSLSTSSREKGTLGRSFDRDTRQVSDAWRQSAKRGVDAMMAAKAHKL